MSAADDIRAEVAEALAEAGAATGDGPLIAVIERAGARSGPAYAPTSASPTEHRANCIVSSYSAMERAGGGVPIGAVKITMAVMDITPSTSDTLTVGGDAYDVERVDASQPAGEVLSWTIMAVLK